MRIGIYGGTFNPIHNTHIEIARAAQKQFNLDRVDFLVAGTPPHKSTSDAIADSNRVSMVQLAIEDEPDFFIDDREIYRPGKSYSYITFQELKKEHPNDELFFIMGSDSLTNFKNWVQPYSISECCTVIAAPRLGDSTDELIHTIHECKNMFDGDFFLIDYTANNISSTTIRKDFYKNTVVRECLSSSVCDYIIEHNLYSEYTYDYDFIKDLDDKMHHELKTGRYIHTVGVANMAYSMALRWDYPA